MIHWDAVEQGRYREFVEHQMLNGCRWLALMAATLFPVFGFLDYFAHAENLYDLLAIRAVASLTCICLCIYIWRKKSYAYPWPFSYFLLSFAGLAITMLCLQNGDFKSPYYAGINLVILAGTLMLPIGPKRTGVMILTVIGVYLGVILLKRGLTEEGFGALVNNMYFILSTAFICLVSSHVVENMRQNSFDRYLQIERAQLHIERSRDLLRKELQSEQENVESLIKELTIRKAELEKALNLRDEFISLASHELNTPLSALKLQTLLAKRKFSNTLALPPEEMDKIIKTYDLQLQRLIRIVGDMLDISRISQGRLELELGQVDLLEIVSRVVELLSPRSEDGILVNGSGPIVGLWDSFKIEQVILNLLTNAIKYGEKRPVEIRLFVSEGKAVIEVRDQGIGISPENQKRIFERFERAVLSREFSGLGLGLYIARQIIKAHDGHIALESELGKGSTFRVELPLFRPV